ncbi:hypothetical protein SSX86_011571 [Deinandra increscens subsp. villosa]|uniref:PHD and RING finger domain-containing protein 1 n=1 Tax=Deinandra increscens subsp. villosa TaxID=3103831 RepID=A0AAP0DBC4_9ASTR
MARNRVGTKGNNRRRVKKRDEDSDESDEEYKVTDDEDSDQSDECYSLDSDESEEMSAEFGKSWKVSRSRNTRRTSSSKKVNETTKPRKRRRVSYTEDDVDEVGDEYVEDSMSSDREANRVKKLIEKKRVSYTKVDDDDEEEDCKDFVLSGRNRKQRKKPQEKNRVVYTDDDDEVEVANEDDPEFMSSDREANHLIKPMEKKRVSYTEEEDDDDDDGGGEFVFSDRNRKERTKPREKKGGLDTEEDEDEEVEVGDDDAEFKQRMKSREKMILDTEEDEEVEVACDDYAEFKQRKKPQDKRVLDTEEDEEEVEVADEDDAEFIKRNQRKKPQEKRVVYTEEDEDEDDDEDGDGDEDEDEDEDEDDGEEYIYSGKTVNQKKKLRKKRGVSYTEDDDDVDLGFLSRSKKRKQKNKCHEERIVSYKEDIQEEEDENDAEFKLSESDFVDDEDETPKIKKNKVTRPRRQKRSVRGGQKKSKRSKIKNPTKPKQRNHRYGQKTTTDKTQMENRNKISKRRNQRAMAESDSDFVSSASSDHEYTISEEEREQMREAKVYCANLRAKLRSSSCGNHEKQPAAYEQKKYPIRKGKEKIKDMKDDLGKQVCGICLSEEQKRTMRGVLNCCRHYFCFSCIMEWSKVESRCPLCKQRFTTITKAAKSDTRFDVRTMVIPVPQCDQVYEPSEEELRGYLDPYESVICTECQNGGDDELMLLCDICDSSAHTFCVGLGREVPEGNWYCEGCRPTVFGTLNSQRLTPDADRRLGNNASDLSSSPIAGGFDLNEAYVPETPLTQQTRIHAEPNSSAPTGTVATTLRDRRRIHRQIHHRFLNNNRMNDFVGRSSGTSASSSGIRLFGNHLDQARLSVSQNDYNLPLVHDSSNFYPRTDQFSVQVQNSNFAPADVALQDEHETLQEFRIGICTDRPVR